MSEPRLRPEDCLKGLETLDSEDQAYLENYFRNFLPLPAKEEEENMMIGRKCRCGKPLLGFFGTFTYDLQHGLGHCASCKWPAVSHHYIKDGVGNEIVKITNFVLLCHPSVVRST